MIREPSPRAPFFGDVPAEVIALIAVIAAVSAAILVGPPRLALWLQGACAVWLGEGRAPYPRPLGPLPPIVLHMFAHASWLHLIVNGLAILAFGTATARRLHAPVLFVGFFLICGVAGALVELALPPAPTSMLGASTGAFGLVAGATYLIRARGGVLPPLLSKDMAIGLAPWVALNAAFALFGGWFGGVQIAWAAHLGGLAAGAVLFPVLDRIADGPH
jgi:membrane associated rhomboid family serine protease